MTSQIAYSDFTGEFRLDINAGEQAKLALYITQYQEELLLKLFGRNLYASFDITPAPAKWTEIITPGTAYYSYQNYSYKYPGIKRMLVAYVYFKWNWLETTQSTPQGETRSTSTNGEAVYNTPKQVNAWNEMRRLYYEVVNYINYKNSLTTDYFADFEYEEIEKINSFDI